MENDYFLHFTAEKKRNSAKDKIKPGIAASIRVLKKRYMNVTLKQFEPGIYQK